MRHLYIHVPFCARRCSYCDFSIAVRRETPVAEYVEGIRRELAMRPLGSPALETVYLGGGTPSRLGGAGIAAVLDIVRSRGTIAEDAEVTIEANPEDVTAADVRAWRNAGVNRISLGAQSFENEVLAWMHRVHDAARISEAVAIARGEGISNLSLDLIFALPETVPRDWRADLERTLALEPEHVSLYGLTVEPSTPLGRWRERGEVSEAPEEHYERDFLTAHEVLAAAGLAHYEVSNFGRMGSRARHNSAYWRRVPYAGLGPSAHGFDGTSRRWNVAPYAEWLSLLMSGADPVGGSELLDDDEINAERVYLGLRTVEGLTLTPEERARVVPWIEAGWGALEGDALRLTPRGWLRLDSLAADLTWVRSR